MVIFKDFINKTLNFYTLFHQSWHGLHGAGQIFAQGMVSAIVEHSGLIQRQNE